MQKKQKMSRFILIQYNPFIWLFFDKKTTAKYFFTKSKDGIYLAVNEKNELCARLPWSFDFCTKLEEEENITNFESYFKEHLQFDS